MMTIHCEKFKNSKPNNGYISGIHATQRFIKRVMTKQILKVLLSNKFFVNIELFVLQFTL